MENQLFKISKRGEGRILQSSKREKMISEEDIQRRAFEIYLENRTISHNVLDDWSRAEIELMGSEQ